LFIYIEEEVLQTIVGVRFKSAGKIYSFGQGSLAVAEGDHVIVETARGMECGKVVTGPREVPDESVPPNLRIVHRIADASDLARIDENRTREREARNPTWRPLALGYDLRPNLNLRCRRL